MYTGRFAPSPTGLLHIGSLLTAVASYADARSNGGKWLVRMEDLDPPREMPGAASHILHTLEAFGFEWDGEVTYQSRRYALYEETLYRLKTAGLVYPCHCNRKDWHTGARRGTDGFVYNGRCRHPGNALHCKANSRRGASASPTATSAFQTASSAVTPKTSPATSAISSCSVQTVTGHTSSPSLPTMPNRALPTSCADKTCSFPHRAKSICSSVWAFRHRNMPTCRC